MCFVKVVVNGGEAEERLDVVNRRAIIGGVVLRRQDDDGPILRPCVIVDQRRDSFTEHQVERRLTAVAVPTERVEVDHQRSRFAVAVAGCTATASVTSAATKAQTMASIAICTL